MQELLNGLGEGDPGALLGRLVASLILLAVLAAIWFLVLRGITRRIDDPTVWYHTRKITSFAVAGVGLLGLLAIWVAALRGLGTFLGLAAAGIAIGLADVLRNIAGWVYIMVRRPFRVDDRIEIDGIIGDVIDIRMFRTSLLEIGNWVDADQSTGRIVHVPNGRTLATEVFNATEGFAYVWHELTVTVTFESDWQRAETLLQEELEAAVGHLVPEAAAGIRQAARSYKIRYARLTPTVYVSVRENGVLLTGRMLVDARQRRAIEQQVWRRLLARLAAEPDVTIAYPTTRTYLAGPLRVQQDGGAHPPASAPDHPGTSGPSGPATSSGPSDATGAER